MISTSSLFFKSCIICMSHETNAFFAHKRRKSQARRKWVEDLAGSNTGHDFLVHLRSWYLFYNYSFLFSIIILPHPLAILIERIALLLLPVSSPSLSIFT
jgi:hypothetical protein